MREQLHGHEQDAPHPHQIGGVELLRCPRLYVDAATIAWKEAYDLMKLGVGLGLSHGPRHAPRLGLEAIQWIDHELARRARAESDAEVTRGRR